MRWGGNRELTGLTGVGAPYEAPTTPALVRLSPQGPSFAPYDGTPALGAQGRDWPVSLIFAGHATVAKVKRALRTVGFTRLGESRWLGYGAPGGAVRFDGDRGLKTACDANGTDVHLRLYAPPGADPVRHKSLMRELQLLASLRSSDVPHFIIAA